MIRRILDSSPLIVDATDGLHNPYTESKSVFNDLSFTALLEREVLIADQPPALPSYQSYISDNVFGEDLCTRTTTSSGLTDLGTSTFYRRKESPSDVPNISSTPSPSERRRRQSPSPVPITTSTTNSRLLPGAPPLQRRNDDNSKSTHGKPAPKKVNSSSQPKADLTSSADCHKVLSSDILDAASPINNVFDGTGSQVDDLIIDVECQVIPFVNDLTQIELRIPLNRFTKAHRRLLKMVAAENDLSVLSPVKDQTNEASIVVRKKASLLQKQQLQLEEQKRAAEEKASQLALEQEELRRRERAEILLRSLPLSQSTRCQANLDDKDDKNAIPTQKTAGRKQIRRQRKKRLVEKKEPVVKRKPKMVDSSMQTVPEDYWLCPWCLQHIPPEATYGHEDMCRAGVRLKQKEKELKARLAQRNADAEARRRQRLGLPPVKKKQQPSSTLTELPVSGRSRSRNRLRDAKGKNNQNRSQSRSLRARSRADPRLIDGTAASELNHVHPNDLSAMARLMQRLCTEPSCKMLVDGGSHQHAAARPVNKLKCPQCQKAYCDLHRPIGFHTSCSKEKTSLTDNASTKVSTSCGWSKEEKQAALKAAMRERKRAFLERRQRD